jgi:hypothetical protein
MSRNGHPSIRESALICAEMHAREAQGNCTKAGAVSNIRVCCDKSGQIGNPIATAGRGECFVFAPE